MIWTEDLPKLETILNEDVKRNLRWSYENI